MQTVSLSYTPFHSSLYNNNKPVRSVQSLASPLRQSKLVRVVHPHSFTAALNLNPLRFSIREKPFVKNMQRNSGVVCYASPITPYTLQWISTISSVVLMFVSGTAIQKSFLVPLFALQAPANIISWIKGEYGIWTVFLALLVRLFFFIPGELELPYITVLLAIVAPYQVLNLRGTKEGTIISLAIAGYLAFQHFSRAGNLRKTFEQGSIVSTLAVICLTVVPCLLLI